MKSFREFINSLMKDFKELKNVNNDQNDFTLIKELQKILTSMYQIPHKIIYYIYF